MCCIRFGFVSIAVEGAEQMSAICSWVHWHSPTNVDLLKLAHLFKFCMYVGIDFLWVSKS